MRMTFKPIDMSELELNALRRATGMQTLQAATIEKLANAFQTHNMYRQNPFLGNIERRNRYKVAFAKAKETWLISDFRKISNRMKEEKDRYAWDIRFTHQLTKEAFWDQALENAETLDDVDKVKTPWQTAARYVYYQSKDLNFLDKNVFSEMEAYIKLARAEIANLNGRTREQERSTIDKFDLYLTDLHLRLKDKQAGMAQAMLVRLQLAAYHQNLAFDDVVYHFSEQLNAVKIAYEEKIGPRPYVAPNQGLTRKDFHRYHQFIQTHGNEATRNALQRLPWVSKGHYVYDTTKKIWGTNKNIIEEAEIPSSRVTFLRRFFRGRNARYDALHDVTRYLEVQIHLSSAKEMQVQLAEGNTDGLSDNKLDTLLQSQRALQSEQQRIKSLRNGLNSIVHRQSKRVLTSYLQEITKAIEGLVKVQKTILQKAEVSLPNLINNETTLDKIMCLLDQFANTVSLLPEGHVLIEEARGIQISLRNQIAQQKLDDFASDLNDLSHKSNDQPSKLEALLSQQRTKSDETGLLYKVVDREAADAYFTPITKYLPPQKAEAFQLIAGILTGNHYREGRQISYDTLCSAMALCFSNNAGSIVQEIIQKIIAPSVYSARNQNPAYCLLLDCEAQAHLEHNRRGDLLRNVAQYEDETLFFALDEALKTGIEFEAQKNVSVGDGRSREDMPMEAFLARITNLDVSTLKSSAADYLALYHGEHETHWRIFEVMPTGEALEYALKRLSFLLLQRDYTAIAESTCLYASQPILKAETDRSDEILTRFLYTVALELDTIPEIDVVMKRFASAPVKKLWQDRRERILLDFFSRQLHQADVKSIVPLREFLEQNKPFPATDWAKENLAVQLQYIPHDTWTAEHHALINVIDDVALRQQYQTNLLRRVLLEHKFANTHAQHLPAEEDIAGIFELNSAPEFEAVCQEALTYFDEQARVDNVDGFRILDKLLMHDMAFMPGLEALRERMHPLREKLKSQIKVQITAQDIISLIDTQHSDEAQKKLHRQKVFLTLCETTGDQDSYDEVVGAITLIIEAMEVRLGQDVLNTDGPPVLLPGKALSLLEEMPSEIPCVEQLQWTLQNQNNLRVMTTLLQTEMHAIRDGRATTLPSLPLLNEAIERQVLGLYLSESNRGDLVESLRDIIDNENVASVPARPRDTLLTLLRLLSNEVQESGPAIFSEHGVRVTVAGAGDDPFDDAASTSTELSIDGDSVPPLIIPVMPTDLQADESREIFQSIITEDAGCEVATEKLKIIFSSTNIDQELKARVAEDFLQFIATACSIRKNGTSEEQDRAFELLLTAGTVLGELKEPPHFPFVRLLQHWHCIETFLNNLFENTIEKIVLDGKSVFPELDELLLIIFEKDLTGNATKEKWSHYLEQTVLPKLASQTPGCNSRFSSVLHAFYRVLKNNASEEDRNNILRYNRHYRDIGSGSMSQTGRVRVFAETRPMQPTPTSICFNSRHSL